MVVLSFQTVHLPHLHQHSLRRRYGCGAIRGGIAEPSGEPAGMGQKTKYNDGLFEKGFMRLFGRKMEKFAPKKKVAEGTKEKRWWEYDYESFVEVSKSVMQGRSRMQQQQVVREVLMSMLPPGAPAQYGPVSKLSLFGIPTVFLHGPAAYKFIYTSDGTTLASHQPDSARMILGRRNIMELSGDEHKRVKEALVSFLKPEVLKRSVGTGEDGRRNQIAH